MVNIKYANAYSEVLEILKYVSQEDYDKIPKNKIKLYETYCNKDYKFTYDITKSLDEQNVSKIAKGIIAILFRDYWATETQRNKIIAKQRYDRQKIEEEKRAKYNIDDLFERRIKSNNEDEQVVNQSLELSVNNKKESFLHKFINKIKSIFIK